MHAGPALRSLGTSSDESGGDGGGRPSAVEVGRGRGGVGKGAPCRAVMPPAPAASLD